MKKDRRNKMQRLARSKRRTLTNTERSVQRNARAAEEARKQMQEDRKTIARLLKEVQEMQAQQAAALTEPTVEVPVEEPKLVVNAEVVG
jgi:hypothetical protein